MKRVAFDVLVAMSILGGTLFGCSSNQGQTSSAAVALGKRGESCQARADCESGLACVNQVCRVESLNLQPTGQTCVTVQCTTATDCCPTPPTYCAQYKMDCDQGDTFYCSYYNDPVNGCICDATTFSCENDKCVQPCTPADAGLSDSCRSVGQVCVDSKCVDCAQDSDCTQQGFGTDRVCTNNTCQIKCAKDTDCSAFFRCDTTTSACVKSGCQSDRDCIVTTSNPLSTCDTTSHDCEVPCQSDLECSSGNTAGGVSGLQVCVNSRCVAAGCENDDECRVLLNVQPGSRVTAVCRMPTPAP